MQGFNDDPLAPVSAQFPLTRPALAVVDNTDRPSRDETRRFGLRHVRVMPEHVIPPYVYCHDQQVSVSSDGSATPMVRISPNMEWSSITDNDGDEGPSEDWGNDFAPNHPGRA
jgi:putative ATP-grasp target RiPP